MTCFNYGGAIVCDGRGGTQKKRSPCPWCCVAIDGKLQKPYPLMLITEIHSGYCAPDYVCGRCGQRGNYEDDEPRRISDAKRQENIREVRTWSSHA